MGFKYTHRVYNDVLDTTAAEQNVLALLAHFADDKTGKCFPSTSTIARMTRLHRSSVMRSLDSLKQRGYLKWISGGRSKNGRAVSNLYQLTLPDPAPKRKKVEFAEFWDDEDSSKSRVARYDHVASLDISENQNPPEAGVDIPGRFELGVARRDGTLEESLKKIADAAQETKRCERKSLVQLAMEAACTDKSEDKRTFSQVMISKDYDNCNETIYQFDCERRAGEFGHIKNLPALLTKRLIALPDKAK